mmetsp:Transcript_77826/g.228150  ORF Transcript_77826/g.228150 Transcript_77826/m.228150 type:complete len:241 (-) Transcript_77826:613-1335(-)
MITASRRFMKRKVMIMVKETQYRAETIWGWNMLEEAHALGLSRRHLLCRTDQLWLSPVSNSSKGVHHSPARKWSCSLFPRSCMISFQASPVDARKSVRKAQKKLRKFPLAACSSECFDAAKRFTPKIPYMISSKRKVSITFASLGSVRIKARKSRFSSWKKPTRRTHLAMRMALPSIEAPRRFSPASMLTPVKTRQRKSTTFRPSVQYCLWSAYSFKRNSTRKMLPATMLPTSKIWFQCI